MGAAPLIAELLLAFILTVYLLNKYGNWRRQHPLVTLSTLIGWYFSFIIIFVLPLDVAIVSTPSRSNVLDLLQSMRDYGYEKFESFVNDPTFRSKQYSMRRTGRLGYWKCAAQPMETRLLDGPIADLVYRTA